MLSNDRLRGRVEVWLVDVARSGSALADIETATPRLSDDERLRARELGTAGDDWRLFRITLRILLERWAGEIVRGAPFQIAPRGKPSLRPLVPVEFSLSHSGHHALIAIAEETLGIDLERERPVRFPADRERAMVAAAQALAPTSPTDGGATAVDFGLLQAWVRLEAWGKARGSGIGALLHDLGIRGPAWSSSAADTEFGERAAGLLNQEQFAVLDLNLPSGFRGALASSIGIAAPIVLNFPTTPANIESLLKPE